jgi:N-acyl-D-amino-acid deacylase
MVMRDVVIRGGTVVDGTGAPAFQGDVAIEGGQIVEVGKVDDQGAREIDATGLHVMPGWVDIHTHYDGQATWDPQLTPSSWHGVTTTVFGNCSVGFAPVRPGCEPFLINLMEGVEDIPGSVLAEGVQFGWESFPEYLDALRSMPRVMDVGAQLPHAALRYYVMGERGADHTEVPTDDEIAEMGRLVVEAFEAGALGFTTSRTKKHRAADGRYTPGLTAGRAELIGIAEAVGRSGRGVIQANSDFGEIDELELLLEMGRVSGRPVSFSLLQVDHHPDGWRELLHRVEQANGEGIEIRGQAGSRPIGVLMGFDTTLNPFLGSPTFQQRGDRPLTDPELREVVLEEARQSSFGPRAEKMLQRTFELGDPPEYEPDPASNVAARAAAAGADGFSLAYDLMLADDGQGLLYHPFENYSHGDLEAVAEMLRSPFTVSGLSDGGAHVATICDASYPTYLVTHWTRDRVRGPRFPLEFVVAKQTTATANAIGLRDRGAITPGLRADVNLVDLDALRLAPPRLVHDLPAGGKRLVQRATGYRHTFVAGVETYTDGEPTGATPGRVLGGQAEMAGRRSAQG